LVQANEEAAVTPPVRSSLWESEADWPHGARRAPPGAAELARGEPNAARDWARWTPGGHRKLPKAVRPPAAAGPFIPSGLPVELPGWSRALDRGPHWAHQSLGSGQRRGGGHAAGAFLPV